MIGCNESKNCVKFDLQSTGPIYQQGSNPTGALYKFGFLLSSLITSCTYALISFSSIDASIPVLSVINSDVFLATGSSCFCISFSISAVPILCNNFDCSITDFLIA